VKEGCNEMNCMGAPPMLATTPLSIFGSVLWHCLDSVLVTMLWVFNPFKSLKAFSWNLTQPATCHRENRWGNFATFEPLQMLYDACHKIWSSGLLLVTSVDRLAIPLTC
jgi:hypothetical protein